MIGLGLGNEKDITLQGLEAIKESDYVFYENYTSISSNLKGLQELTKKEFILSDRNLVESNSESILEKAIKQKVSFLVIGDVFGATTHTDLFLRATKKGIKIKIINNASIINVVGNTGLELYRFGQTTSIVFDDDNWLPDTPYNVIKNNKEKGLHTLCLLDIKTAEPSTENLRKGINKPEPARFMTINQGIEILEKLEQKNKQNIINKDTQIIGIARIGTNTQIIKPGTIEELKKQDFGEPLHSIIIPGNMHDIEREMLEYYKNNQNVY